MKGFQNGAVVELDVDAGGDMLGPFWKHFKGGFVWLAVYQGPTGLTLSTTGIFVDVPLNADTSKFLRGLRISAEKSFAASTIVEVRFDVKGIGCWWKAIVNSVEDGCYSVTYLSEVLKPSSDKYFTESKVPLHRIRSSVAAMITVPEPVSVSAVADEPCIPFTASPVIFGADPKPAPCPQSVPAAPQSAGKSVVFAHKSSKPSSGPKQPVQAPAPASTVRSKTTAPKAKPKMIRKRSNEDSDYSSSSDEKELAKEPKESAKKPSKEPKEPKDTKKSKPDNSDAFDSIVAGCAKGKADVASWSPFRDLEYVRSHSDDLYDRVTALLKLIKNDPGDHESIMQAAVNVYDVLGDRHSADKFTRLLISIKMIIGRAIDILRFKWTTPDIAEHFKCSENSFRRFMSQSGHIECYSDLRFSSRIDWINKSHRFYEECLEKHGKKCLGGAAPVEDVVLPGRQAGTALKLSFCMFES